MESYKQQSLFDPNKADQKRLRLLEQALTNELMQVKQKIERQLAQKKLLPEMLVTKMVFEQKAIKEKYRELMKQAQVFQR